MVAKKAKVVMKLVIQFSVREERQALPILLRHSPGTVAPERTYIVSEEAAMALRKAGVNFTELSQEATAPNSEELQSGERI
jgi:hypothetical protein